MALFVLSLCPFYISVCVGAFVIGLSQISSFLSVYAYKYFFIIWRDWVTCIRKYRNISASRDMVCFHQSNVIFVRWSQRFFLLKHLNYYINLIKVLNLSRHKTISLWFKCTLCNTCVTHPFSKCVALLAMSFFCFQYQQNQHNCCLGFLCFLLFHGSLSSK